MVLRSIIVMLIAVSAHSVQARDVIIGSAFGIVNVVDIDNCDVPHMKSFATTDVYARQMVSDSRGYVRPFLDSVVQYDWFCRRSANDFLLSIDYHVLGVKIAEIELKIVQEQQPWIIESVKFLEGVETPQSSASDFMSRVVLDKIENQSLTIPMEELEEFAAVEDGFSGRADVLATLAYLKSKEQPQFNIEFGSRASCDFDKPTMERAAESGSSWAMFMVAQCLNDGTSIDAIRNGHPGLTELSASDYDKFRFFLAKSLFAGFLPASLYVSHPIPQFRNQIPLDKGTIAEVHEIIEKLVTAEGEMSFEDYLSDSSIVRSVTSTEVRRALNDWLLEGECNFLSGGNYQPRKGWCVSSNLGSSVSINIGDISNLECKEASVSTEQCAFVFKQNCLADSTSGAGAGELFCQGIREVPSPTVAVFRRDDSGKLTVVTVNGK